MSYADQLERARQAHSQQQNDLAVEWTKAEARNRKDARRETVARALASVLRQGLSATPDVFQGTRLAPSTVDAFAEQWADEIL